MKLNVRYLINGTSFIPIYHTRQHLKIYLNASSVALIEARIKFSEILSNKFKLNNNNFLRFVVTVILCREVRLIRKYECMQSSRERSLVY